MKKQRLIFDLLLISLLGLIPLLWFQGNQVILGHDAGLPFDPVTHFIDRFYVWTQRFGLGTDQSALLLGAFFIHGIEALLTWLGFSLQWQQKIQFIFWFVLPGFTMYFFAYSFWKDRRYLPLFASVIYMINFYLIQGWFVAERTKFSLYAAVPLIFYFLFRYMTGALSFFWTMVLTGITFGILNGGGSFPLYGGLVLGMLIFFVYINFINWNWITLRRTVFYSVGTLIIYSLFNAYWLIPYGFYLSGSFSNELAAAGGVDGAINWAKYLSAQSTFLNLFRGQGVPEWYLNAYHSYAQNYFSNPLLIIGSFLFPILAFISLLLIKTKRDAFYLYLFVMFALAGIFFSAGPQSQLGSLFEFFMRYIPGFAMFRSAFYKFNYLMWFSYAILIAYSLDVIFFSLQKRFEEGRLRKLFSASIIVLFVGLYVGYHFPILSGSFFDYSHEPGKELTTRVTVPNYIFEFGEWVNTQDPNKRFLIMPQLGKENYISYQWGYWSLAPINSLLTRNSFVHNTGLASHSEKVLMDQMYTAFLRGDMESFSDYLDVFGINAIVLQKDLDWQNESWGTYDPKRYERILENNELFALEETFGEWEVYDIKDRETSLRMSATSNLQFLQGKFGNIASFPEYDPTAPLFISAGQEQTEKIAKNATEVLLAPECIQCDLQRQLVEFKYYNPKVLPGSTLYPFIRYQEKKAKESAQTFDAKVTYYVTFADRKIVETKWMLDSNINMTSLPETVIHYKELIAELKNHLSQPAWHEDGSKENEMAQLILYHTKEQVNIIDTLFKKDTLLLDNRQILAYAYEDILDIREMAEAKLWVTENMEEKRYIVSAQKAGDYELFVKKGSLTDPTNNISKVEIGFKENPTILTPIREKEDWISFGKVTLPAKKQHMFLKDATISNKLQNASLIYTDGTKGISVEDEGIFFTTDSLSKCVYYNLTDLQVVDKYSLTFYYRNLSEQQNLSFFMKQPDEPFLRYAIKNSYLPNSRTWLRHTLLIEPKTEELQLYFCNGFLSFNESDTLKENKEFFLSLSDDDNINEVREVTLHKVSQPDIIFYQKQKNVQDVPLLSSFIKKDLITYEATLNKSDEPFSVIMRESYGKYWQLCDSRDQCRPFDDIAHFSTGGFANAWYFDRSEGETITLHYYSQRMYLIGAIITGITIISILGLIWWKKRKTK